MTNENMAGDQAGPQAPTSFLAQHWQKLAALAIWLLVIGGYVWYTQTNNLSPLEAVKNLIGYLQSSMFGPLFYILLYALRPLIFFPATLLTVAGGFLFGPVWGVFYTIIAGNASAMVAYLVGRYFGQGLLNADDSSGIIQRYASRMRNNSFTTVLIMRLILLPYDLVNYLGGFLRIDWKAFLLATALGSIPGTISVVLFGASFEGNFGEGLPSFNPWSLVFSVGLLLVSLGLSRYFKRQEQDLE
ncbi:MAG: TVP38/TMEM64 family protein [Caldilineaceae bacterium]